MALIVKDGKETRVPGRAIPEVQRREGALGKLDAISLGEFKKLPLLEKQEMLKYAVIQKRRARIDELVKAEFLDVLEGKIAKVHYWHFAQREDRSDVAHTPPIVAREEFPVVFHETQKAVVLFAMPTKYYKGIASTQAKYIILKTPEKDYVAAMPICAGCFGEEHADIVRLFRYVLKISKDIDLPEKKEDIRGGYVEIGNAITVDGRSDKYGEGPHDEVRALLREAAYSKLDTLLKTCREKGFKELEAVLVNISHEEGSGSDAPKN